MGIWGPPWQANQHDITGWDISVEGEAADQLGEKLTGRLRERWTDNPSSTQHDNGHASSRLQMRAAKELRFVAAGMWQENTTLTLDSGSSPTVETPIPASPMTQVRTTSPDLPSLTTPSRSPTPGHGFADASPRRSPDSSPARGYASPTSSHTVGRSSPLHPAPPSGSSEPTFCGFSPAPASDSDEGEKSGFSPSAEHVTDTRLQESECSERSSICRRGVAGESPHLRGISRQNQNPPPTPCCPAPVQKTKPQKNPRPAGPPPPKIPQSITGRSHRPPLASPRRLRRPVSVNVSCVPREKRKNVHTSSRFIWRPAHWPTSSATARIPSSLSVACPARKRARDSLLSSRITARPRLTCVPDRSVLTLARLVLVLARSVLALARPASRSRILADKAAIVASLPAVEVEGAGAVDDPAAAAPIGPLAELAKPSNAPTRETRVSIWARVSRRRSLIPQVISSRSREERERS